MGHYAFLNSDNEVVEVITGVDEDDTATLPTDYSSWEEFYETQRDGLTCKRTSYNTRSNTHILDGTAFRGNYAGIGYSYDPENDVFIPPQPFPSWTLDQSTWNYEAPISYPDDDNDYYWDEAVYQADTSDPKTAGWVQIES